MADALATVQASITGGAMMRPKAMYGTSMAEARRHICPYIGRTCAINQYVANTPTVAQSKSVKAASSLNLIEANAGLLEFISNAQSLGDHGQIRESQRLAIAPEARRVGRLYEYGALLGSDLR
ncbi:hypothetical protein D3C73_1377780 [compost metagenome]